jgi:hypothetical protein
MLRWTSLAGFAVIGASTLLPAPLFGQCAKATSGGTGRTTTARTGFTGGSSGGSFSGGVDISQLMRQQQIMLMLQQRMAQQKMMERTVLIQQQMIQQQMQQQLLQQQFMQQQALMQQQQQAWLQGATDAMLQQALKNPNPYIRSIVTQEIDQRARRAGQGTVAAAQ